jgi:hypothetical protein
MSKSVCVCVCIYIYIYIYIYNIYIYIYIYTYIYAYMYTCRTYALTFTCTRWRQKRPLLYVHGYVYTHTFTQQERFDSGWRASHRAHVVSVVIEAAQVTSPVRTLSTANSSCYSDSVAHTYCVRVLVCMRSSSMSMS